MSARVNLAAVAVGTLLATAPAANAAAGQLCDELGATWDGTNCTTLVTSQRKAEMFISLALPAPLLDDPTTGPALNSYYHRLMDGWRKTGSATPRDSSASADYQVYSGPGPIQSVIIHETFMPFGIQANNAYRSFVFDMAQRRRLDLTDLFKPGVDPVAAVSAAAAPALPAALDTAAPPHAPNTYPFTVQEWQPGPDGPGYSGEYRAFGLTADDLILYLPDAPMPREAPFPNDRLVWSMDGGSVTVRMPLSAMAESLRPEYGGR